jgi:hypothetical protein
MKGNMVNVAEQSQEVMGQQSQGGQGPSPNHVHQDMVEGF